MPEERFHTDEFEREGCQFLGKWEHRGWKFDLYWRQTQQTRLPTVIARFGNSERECLSGLVLAELEPAIAEAKERAKKLGLEVEPFRGINEGRG